MRQLSFVVGFCVAFLWSAVAMAQQSADAQIADALFPEMLRVSPGMADNQQAQRDVLFQYLNPDLSKQFKTLSPDQQQAYFAQARDWIAARTAEPSALPLSILVSLPGQLRLNPEGGYVFSAQNSYKSGKFISGTLDELRIRRPGMGTQISIVPIQPFNMTDMRPPAAIEPVLRQIADKREGVMMIARITVSDMSPADGSARAVAGGKVESVALHRLSGANQQLVAGALIWEVPATAQAAAVTLAQIETTLRLRKRDGAYLDDQQGGQSGLSQLLQWRALTALPIEQILQRRLAPNLFWQAYGQFASRALQDELVAPHLLLNGRNRFVPHVNDIEKRALEDKVLRALIPAIAAALPDEPLPVISLSSNSMSAYNFDRGGFEVYYNRGGWVFGGSYPLVKDVPDFFTIDQNAAQQVLDRMAALDGAGRRFLTLRAAYGLSTLRAEFAPEGPLNLPQITPGFDLSALSLHAGRTHADDQSLATNKLADLDPAVYRGPVQAVAGASDIAQWEAFRADKGARGEDLIAAALQVSDDQPGLLQAMNRTGQVADPAAVAGQLQAPSPLILTGQLGFVEDGGGWSLRSFRWTYQSNESGLTPPQIEFADTSALRAITFPADQQQKFKQIGGQVMFRAVTEPVATAVRNNRPVLFVRFAELALFSRQEGDDGLPFFNTILTPEPASAAAPTQPAEVTAPDQVVLDHDYLDLLMIKQLGDELSDTTLDRMLLDRMHRELRAPDDLPWGRFFDQVPQQLNRVERMGMLPGFRAWQQARAAQLPSSVVLRSTINPNVVAACGQALDAAPSQANRYSVSMRAVLDQLGYDAIAQNLATTRTMLERIAREVQGRKPVVLDQRVMQMGGRPIYQLLGSERHASTTGCPNQRLGNVTDGFDVRNTRSADAVFVLNTSILLPNERQKVVEIRHVADITAVDFVAAPTPAGQGPALAGTFRIDLDVRENVFYPQDALKTPYQPNPTGKPVRASVAQIAALKVEPPSVADILGLDLQTPEAELSAALATTTPMQRAYDEALERAIAKGHVNGIGEAVNTRAFTRARMRIDLDAQEALLELSDARTGAARLALGRAKLYDPAKVDVPGLAGALIKKYGTPALTQEDRNGGQTLNRYVWGFDPKISMPHCLPPLNQTVARELRDSFVINEDIDRAFFNLAELMKWPHLEPVVEDRPDYALCQPLVVAEISSYRDQRSLVTYVIDLSPLSQIDWGARAGAKSADDLAKEAADIDL